MNIGRHSGNIWRQSVNIGRHSGNIGRHSESIGHLSRNTGRHSGNTERHSFREHRASFRVLAQARPSQTIDVRSNNRITQILYFAHQSPKTWANDLQCTCNETVSNHCQHHAVSRLACCTQIMMKVTYLDDFGVIPLV
jgi:hypothetical protein